MTGDEFELQLAHGMAAGATEFEEGAHVKKSRRVTIVHSDVLLRIADRNPRISGRVNCHSPPGLVPRLRASENDTLLYGLTDHLN